MANYKTINLTGSEIAVEISGQNCDIRNDGTDTVYISRRPLITAGADGVMSVPAGQAAKLLDSNGTAYLTGTGTVLLCGNDYSELVFKVAATSSGEGGTVDEQARTAIANHANNTEIHVSPEENDVLKGKCIDITYQEVDVNSLTCGSCESKTYLNRLDAGAAKITNLPPDFAGKSVQIKTENVYYAASGSKVTKQTLTSHKVPYSLQRYVTVAADGSSTTTEWVNVSDGGNADTLNGKTADEIITGATVVCYTFVVDSDEKLAAWAGAASGKDYSHVLIKRGTWAMANADGINLTAAGTITVTGEGGSLIRNVVNSTGSVYGLHYDALPELGQGYGMFGVNVDVENTTDDVAANNPIFCFANCSNLINCNASGRNHSSAINQNTVAGFYSCEQLSHCCADMTETCSTTGVSPGCVGFAFCGCLSNCSALCVRKTGGDGYAMACGFKNCEKITGCTVYADGDINGNGMENCGYISGSYAFGSSATGARAFTGCYSLNDCEGFAESDTEAASFYSCKDLAACRSSAIKNMLGTYFKCERLTNCCVTIPENHDGDSVADAMFSYCTGMGHCFVDNKTAEEYTSFYNCSANQGEYNAQYACANTPEGGWNYSVKA